MRRAYRNLITAAALGVLATSAQPVLAKGCYYNQPSQTYAFVQCTGGYLDRGLVRVIVKQCNDRRCWNNAGKFISRAGYGRSEVKVRPGYRLKKRDTGVETQTP